MPTATSRDQVASRLAEALVEFGADREAIGDEVTFEALDVDSLDLVELAQIVDEEYSVQITTDDMKDLRTVGQAIDLVVGRSA